VNVIARPERIRPIPGRLAPEVHREIERDGQRLVFDLFLDDADQIVQRGVNMATGKVVWFAFDLPDDRDGPYDTREERDMDRLP
jgi:hypothetical protein